MRRVQCRRSCRDEMNDLTVCTTISNLGHGVNLGDRLFLLAVGNSSLFYMISLTVVRISQECVNLESANFADMQLLVFCIQAPSISFYISRNNSKIILPF